MGGRSLGAIIYSGSFGDSESGGSMNMGIQYAYLDSAAFDTTLYTFGGHPVVELGIRQGWRPKGEKYSLSTHTEIKFGNGFSTASFETKIKLNFTKKLSVDIRLWTGSFLNNKKVPNHFRSYLSGGVDPTFSSLILDRTGQSKMAIIQNQYPQDISVAFFSENSIICSPIFAISREQLFRKSSTNFSLVHFIIYSYLKH